MKPKAFIFGGFVNGLGLVRSLSAEGIHSDIFDIEPCLAGQSKYATYVKSPCPEDEDAFIAFVASHAKAQALKPVCFITNDIWLVPLLKHRHRLENFMHFPMSQWSLIERCYDKRHLAELCKFYDIPHPATFFPKNTAEIRANLSNLNYPVILKPVETIGFMETLRWDSRNRIINEPRELQAIITHMDNVGFSHRRVMLQEIVPGDVKSLYTFTSYSNKDGHVVAWSIGHKLRQIPPEAGTISAGKVTPNPKLEKLGIQLIECLGFYGIANTEFKLDEETGQFKLIEVNARPGMWNLSALKTGVNLPLLAYAEVCGFSKYKISGTSDSQLVWINSLYDFMYFFVGVGCERKFQHGIIDRIRENRGKKIQSILSASDPKPFFWMILRAVKRRMFRGSK